MTSAFFCVPIKGICFPMSWMEFALPSSFGVAKWWNFTIRQVTCRVVYGWCWCRPSRRVCGWGWWIWTRFRCSFIGRCGGKCEHFVSTFFTSICLPEWYVCHVSLLTLWFHTQAQIPLIFKSLILSSGAKHLITYQTLLGFSPDQIWSYSNQTKVSLVWLTLFNAKLSLKRYWWGLMSQEVGGEGDYT